MPAAQSLRINAGRFLREEAERGFSRSLDVQFGLHGHPVLVAALFPVSMVLLALREAFPTDPSVLELIAREAPPLAALGDEHGWRYFNLVPEIPPDADDLAQAIALLLAAGWQDLDAKLAGPLTLLARNRVAPGRYRTWLVDDADPMEVDRQWGCSGVSVHPEVVANLAHALWQLDPRRHGLEAQAAADYLVSVQESGLWPSYWYYGMGYGTFQAARLLCELPGGSRPLALAAMRAALIASQAPDGGWAMARAAGAEAVQGATFSPLGESSALETAFCAAALRQLPGDPQRDAALAAARAFLASRQDPDGGFAAEPCYMTMRVSAHGSRGLTTAAVLWAVGPGS